jgi:hypothetical protein
LAELVIGILEKKPLRSEAHAEENSDAEGEHERDF